MLFSSLAQNVQAETSQIQNQEIEEPQDVLSLRNSQTPALVESRLVDEDYVFFMEDGFNDDSIRKASTLNLGSESNIKA